MFCIKCGKEIQEGTVFCPFCGMRTDIPQNNNFQNQQAQAPYMTYQNQQFQMPYAPVKKKANPAARAWFAPVAIVLMVILQFALNALQTLLYNWIGYDSYSGYYIAYAIVSFLKLALFLAICLGLFFIAFSGIEARKRKLSLPMSVLPIVFYYVSSSLNGIALDIVLSFANGVYGSTIISTVGSIVLGIISAVLSFVIVHSYLKSVDSIVGDKEEAETNPSAPTNVNSNYIDQ